MEKLRKVGFNFGEDEHLCWPGCVYYWNGKNYIIGGDDIKFKSGTKTAQKAAAEGSRLATEWDLLRYIEDNGYSFKIKRSTEDRYYYADFVGDNGHTFSASGPGFDIFLYKSVFKIARYINLGR
jgi:hypothetical protein